jgi:predicted RNA polymerase sigma factor
MLSRLLSAKGAWRSTPSASEWHSVRTFVNSLVTVAHDPLVAAERSALKAEAQECHMGVQDRLNKLSNDLRARVVEEIRNVRPPKGSK